MIGENRYFSFADAGLTEEYNSDFLSLRDGKGSKPERNQDYHLAPQAENCPSRQTPYLKQHRMVEDELDSQI